MNCEEGQRYGDFDFGLFLDLALDFDLVRSLDLDLNSRVDFRFLEGAGVSFRSLVREVRPRDGDLDICLFLDLALDFGLHCSRLDLSTDLDFDRSSLPSIGVFTFRDGLGQ